MQLLRHRSAPALREADYSGDYHDLYRLLSDQHNTVRSFTTVGIGNDDVDANHLDTTFTETSYSKNGSETEYRQQWSVHNENGNPVAIPAAMPDWHLIIWTGPGNGLARATPVTLYHNGYPVGDGSCSIWRAQSTVTAHTETDSPPKNATLLHSVSTSVLLRCNVYGASSCLSPPVLPIGSAQSA